MEGPVCEWLRDTAHYVQIVAKQNLPALLSSGFIATDRNTTPTPLIQPFIKQVRHHVSGQLWLQVARVPNARLCQVRLKVGDGEWADGGTYTQARRIVLDGLTPGTVYALQVCAIGESTGFSQWSGMVSTMAT